MFVNRVRQYKMSYTKINANRSRPVNFVKKVASSF